MAAPHRNDIDANVIYSASYRHIFIMLMINEGYDDMYFALFCVTAAVCLIFYKGARIVRPTQRGLIESFGRYKRFAKPGFHWVIPIIRKLYIVSVCEQMFDIRSEEHTSELQSQR